MTPEEWAELLDLFLDGALPEAWQARVDTHLTGHPEAAADAESLRGTLSLLAAAPIPRPEGWFVERALQGVLQEHRTETASDFVKELHK